MGHLNLLLLFLKLSQNASLHYSVPRACPSARACAGSLFIASFPDTLCELYCHSAKNLKLSWSFPVLRAIL